MKKTTTAKITTEPVAWSGEKTLMFQSRFSYVVDDDRTVSIYGNPARDEQAAKEELRKELGIWKTAISAFVNAMDKEKKQ